MSAESEKNTQRNLTQRCLFLPPPSPPGKILCVCVFFTFQREKQPEHKEFQGLTAPKRGLFRHGILGEIFVFGCLFGPEVIVLVQMVSFSFWLPPWTGHATIRFQIRGSWECFQEGCLEGALQWVSKGSQKGFLEGVFRKGILEGRCTPFRRERP